MLKSTLFSLVLLSFALAGVSIAGPKADIRQLEEQFNAAYAANDFDKYFSYYADDAIFWFPEGRTDIPRYKKMWSDYLKTGAAIKAATLSDVHIRFSPRGDVAIASYVLRLTTQEADKKEHTEDHQESDVWFKANGGWKIAHVHYSDVPVPTKH
jgi:ketosteroid isomerase-like protein